MVLDMGESGFLVLRALQKVSNVELAARSFGPKWEFPKIGDPSIVP